MAGKIQNEDVKTLAELTGAGGSASQLINDTKIYVTATGLNKQLSQAIIDGDIAGSTAWGDITGTLSSQTDLQTALDAKAPLASPAFTGNPTAPTPTTGDNDTSIATTAFVTTAVSTAGTLLAQTAKTANYTITGSDAVITGDASGGAFTFTLPPSASNNGKIWYLSKTDSSLTQITIDGNASETVGGALTTTLATQGETALLLANGTNISILNRYIPSNWTSYTPTFSASFGTTSGVAFKYRRVGDSIQVMGQFTCGTVTAAIATMTLPSGLTIATSIPVANTTAAAGPQVGYWAGATDDNLGAVLTATGTNNALLYFSPFTIGGSSLTPANASATFGSNQVIDINFTVPITGWNG